MTDDQKQSAAVVVEGGQVLIDGPGFAVTMSPESAADTSELLFHAAIKAKGHQMVERHHPKQPRG
jgi:hypothetical protein